MQSIRQIDDFEGGHEISSVIPPEHKLAIEVIKRAINDAYVYRKALKKGKITRSAHELKAAYLWINSEDSIEFSFRWWCEHIGVDFRYLQSEIERIQYKLPKMNACKTLK